MIDNIEISGSNYKVEESFKNMSLSVLANLTAIFHATIAKMSS